MDAWAQNSLLDAGSSYHDEVEMLDVQIGPNVDYGPSILPVGDCFHCSFALHLHSSFLDCVGLVV